MGTRYTLHQWSGGDASLTVTYDIPRRHNYKPNLGFTLLRNPDGGYDVHEDSRFDVPVATVDCLPEALEWAMSLTEPKGD